MGNIPVSLLGDVHDDFLIAFLALDLHRLTLACPRSMRVRATVHLLVAYNVVSAETVSNIPTVQPRLKVQPLQPRLFEETRPVRPPAPPTVRLVRLSEFFYVAKMVHDFNFYCPA